MRWFVQIAGLALVAVLTAGGWYYLQSLDADNDDGAARGGGGSVPVRVVEAREESVRDVLDAVGTTLARESVDIVAEAAGRIVQTSVREGEQVEEGEILFRLDSVREEADLRQARAEREDAAAKYRRARALREDNSVSQAQVDELRAALEVAESRVEVAQSRLRDREIRAPFDGIVGLREVSRGAYVEPGTQLTTLDDLSVVRLDFSVPERFLGGLVPGLEVEGRAAGFPETPFEGTVSRVAPRVDPVTRSARAQAEFDNEAGHLRSGMFLTVRLTLGQRDAVVVPEEALLFEARRRYVFRVVDDHLERLTVDVGQRSGGRVEIRGDVRAGDTIVVAGLQRARDGAQARVVDDAEAHAREMERDNSPGSG